MTADYLVLAMPASLLRRVPILPALPTPQHQAIASLGIRPRDEDAAAVRSPLLASARQAARVRFAAAVRRAVGSQRRAGGEARHPVAPGWRRREQATQADDRRRTASSDSPAACRGWAMQPAAPVASRQIVWESDPFARGGYAFFGPSFDPALREWLARPAGRLFFAGEHTSLKWQGYMNGAVESGRRAALEVRATARRCGQRLTLPHRTIASWLWRRRLTLSA